MHFDLDILLLTETWHRNASDPALCDVTPLSYNCVSKCRENNRTGGGLAVLFKSTLKHRVISFPEFCSFEHVCVSFLSPMPFSISLIYRPPSSSMSLFVSEFDSLLEKCFNLTNHIVFGDLNIHFDAASNPTTISVSRLLDNYDMHQFVNVSTHVAGHILDVVVARPSDNFIKKVTVHDLSISDHCFVLCESLYRKPRLSKKVVAYRDWKNLNLDLLQEKLESAMLCNENFLSGAYDINFLTDCYNYSIASVVDEVLPLQTKTITIRPHVSWYSQELIVAKRLRRRLERRWRKSASMEDRQKFVAQRNLASSLVVSAKAAFYNKKINDLKTDRDYWSFFRNVLGKTLPLFLMILLIYSAVPLSVTILLRK